jgi:hypothetical protein
VLLQISNASDIIGEFLKRRGDDDLIVLSRNEANGSFVCRHLKRTANMSTLPSRTPQHIVRPSFVNDNQHGSRDAADFSEES